jgi:hypothetical protein
MRLDGVQAVQTRSRLNRTHPGKDGTFVLDFVNDSDAILKAFEPYYRETLLAETADPNDLYTLQHRLTTSGVFETIEVESFAKVFYAARQKQSEKDHAVMNAVLTPAVDRFAALDADAQEAFRADLSRYVSLYTILSQVMPFSDADLERLYAFARMLALKLPQDPKRAPVQLGGEVGLKYYRLQMISTGRIQLGVAEQSVLKGLSVSPIRSAAEQEVPLSEVIESLNTRFGTDFTEADALMIEQMTVRKAGESKTVQLAAVNTFDNFMLALKKDLEDDVIDQHDRNTDFVNRYLNDGTFREAVERMLGQRIYAAARAQRANDGPPGPALDVGQLLEVSALRNLLEPKLRRAIRSMLFAHLGSGWIRAVLDAVPEEQRKQLQGVDAEKILGERLFLQNLITVVVTGWDKYFKAFESGAPSERVSKEAMKVLLEYINAHREDAHAKPISEADAAALRIAVGALDQALDRFLAA